jgi:hypothetical protein
MNLEPLCGAILDEYDYGVIAAQEDLVIPGCHLLRKIVSERDLRPAANQRDLAGFFQPAVKIHDQPWFIHNMAMAIATASTPTGNRLGKRARGNSIDRTRDEVMFRRERGRAILEPN